MPEESLLPGLVVAVAVLTAGVLLLIARRPLTARLQTANHHRQLMDPTVVAGLVMLTGTSLLLIGVASAGYFALRILGLFAPTVA